MSKIETNQVDPSTGSTLTLGTSGDTIAIPSGVTIANSGTATGFGGGLLEADFWRLTADITNTNADITSNLARDTSTGFAKIGTGMSESSGIFTFGRTGLYQITGYANWKVTNENLAYLNMSSTIDNSNYTVRGEIYSSTSASDHYKNSSAAMFLNVTDTSQCKVKFTTGSMNANVTLRGSAGAVETHFVFLRLGDSQ